MRRGADKDSVSSTHNFPLSVLKIGQNANLDAVFSEGIEQILSYLDTINNLGGTTPRSISDRGD